MKEDSPSEKARSASTKREQMRRGWFDWSTENKRHVATIEFGGKVKVSDYLGHYGHRDRSEFYSKVLEQL